MAPVTERNNVPMVEANGASRSLFKEGYKYLFAVLSTSEQYLQSAVALRAQQAKADGKDPSSMKIAGAFENDPFSQDIRAGVLDNAKEYGMSMVIDDQLPPTLDDMSSTLTKVKALQPDLLVVSGHAKGAILAIRQLSEMKVHVPMLAMTHCDSAEIIKKFGKAAEYTLCASQWDRSLSYKDDLFGTAEEFAQQFENEYEYAPPYQAAESAAAVEVYADAMQRAGSLDPQKVRDALAATKIQTFYGNIDFDDTGKNTAKPMVLFQVQDGEYKVVAPSKWASADLRYPIPPWSER
jgi:branched-chain amino acid transport system substrate-binding protein